MAARIRANPDYIELEQSRRTFGRSLAVIMLAIYYGFICLVAFFPSVIGIPVAGNVTLGLLLGLGVITSAILLTGLYVARANTKFDALSSRVVASASARVVA